MLTDEDFVTDMECLSPLGKSDHAALTFSCDLESSRRAFQLKPNYSKGNYEKLSSYMNIEWEDCTYMVKRSR